MEDAEKDYYNSQIKELNKKLEEQTKVSSWLLLIAIAMYIIGFWWAEKSMNKSYDSGWKDAEREYYDSRYEEGYEEGYNNGYDTGHYNGYDCGYGEGYDEGYDEGCYDGYVEGYDVGSEDGYATALYDYDIEE